MGAAFSYCRRNSTFALNSGVFMCSASCAKCRRGQSQDGEEFLKANKKKTQAAFADALKGIELTHEPHIDFKKRVPHAIDLIRTGDTTQYANIILVPA